MTWPTPHTVGVHHCTAGAVDDYNETAEVYVPAETAAGVPVKVCGWSVPSSTEPAVAGHDRVIVDVQLFALPEVAISADDLVDILVGPHAGQYEVIGGPEDYNFGPWPFRVPLIHNLRKVSG